MSPAPSGEDGLGGGGIEVRGAQAKREVLREGLPGEVPGGRVVTGWRLPAGRPQSFARQTLRTLCLAYKRVDEDTYQEWCRRHQEASTLLQNRARALHQVYEEMEQNLQVGVAGRWGALQLPGSSPVGPQLSHRCPGS